MGSCSHSGLERADGGIWNGWKGCMSLMAFEGWRWDRVDDAEAFQGLGRDTTIYVIKVNGQRIFHVFCFL
jgi:hypothetical protein